jgi:hypothetical protein
MTSKSKKRRQKDRAEANLTKLSLLPAVVGGVAVAGVLYILQIPPFLILLAAVGTALIASVRLWERL